jgi:hypothetical protein
MARRSRSSIRQLPDELRKEVDRLLADGRHTIRDVTQHLRSLGADVSKSAVHRYSQDFEQVAADIRLTREMAVAIGRELSDVPEGDSGRLVIESLQALLLRARKQLADTDTLDVPHLAALSRAAKDLQTALKSSVDTEIKVRERAARDAAKAAEEVATEQGLSAPTVEAIKARILGITTRAA